MTQLEMLNFEGKTIYPFNTHEGSGKGNSINDIKASAPNANVKDGFALKGTDARKTSSHKSIRNWLKDQMDIDVPDNDEEEEENDGNISIYKNSKYIKMSCIVLLSALFFF